MSFCLPQDLANKFKEALTSGKVDPAKLSKMTSAQRNAFFSDLIGKENATDVNALFESKLLLKNIQGGMINWAKKVAGLNEITKRDLVSKIERLDKVLEASDEQVFLNDLASQKLGTEVSFEEAQHITELSKAVQEKRDAVDSTSLAGSEDRLDYGAARVALTNYVGELKLANESPSVAKFKEEFKQNPLKTVKDAVVNTAGVAKAVNASIDNSFWGRQGFKAIFTNPREWASNFAKSFKDIAGQLKVSPENNDIINGIKADAYSRPNALNGNYERMKLDIGIKGEEAYPSTLPEKIPGLGRVFKASEVAYTGGALRLRVDIADRIIKIAEDNGVDLTDVKEAQSIGKLVNSLTGRGDLGKAQVFAKEINTTLFSPKSLKASFDFLTAHQLQKDVTPFVRKQAAINLIKVASGVAVILSIAKALDPDSVETDPRSSDFGKIKVGDTRFDLTGGMASMITLGARTIPGLWGKASTKSSTTGKITPLNSGEFGAKTIGDVFWDFGQNKLSPAAGALNDVFFRGKDFKGNKPTVASEAKNLAYPLPIKNIEELSQDPNAANIWVASIMDSLGIVTNTYKK